jgi:phage major head subunit gpT-like protein
VSVGRDDLADDRLGVFRPMVSEMGTIAARHADELVFELLKSGFDTLCFDGQNFFDTDHPIENADGATVSTVSNMQAGAGPGWYLLDVSRGVRPIIWQEREGYEFTSVNRHDEAYVFTHDDYMYGVRARVNAGFGLWQLAFGSKDTLNATNYAAARAAMMDFRSDGSKVLGISPSILVVPPALEDPAFRLINSEFGSGGESNPWKGTAKVIVTPYVG